MWKKILLMSILIFSVIFIASCTNSNKAPTGAVISEIGTVKIPLTKVTNAVKKYTYAAQGTKVTYFAVRGSDGKVRTAFDACDVCGGSKGYQQSGGDITCTKCGKVFRIDGLGSKNKEYGCWPSYLSHEIKNGNILIKTSEIAAGKHRFN
tara:strand:+ start:156 stop:605 length:450 start_codon:yes stop_codon:yes gene_type:complete